MKRTRGHPAAPVKFPIKKFDKARTKETCQESFLLEFEEFGNLFSGTFLVTPFWQLVISFFS